MSSRGGRRDRSWERDDRDRNRYSSRGERAGGVHRDGRRRSRSRSPLRGDRERMDRRDYGREMGDERRDRDRRDGHRRDSRRRDDKDDRRRDDRDDRRKDDRDDRRRDEEKEREVRKDRANEPRSGREKTIPTKERSPRPSGSGSDPYPNVIKRPNLDPDGPDREEGEAMDVTTEDDAAMMAMMGMAGFGTTKGKHVEGNQEGAVNVKKIRTWRQYMNRRGGFNRPLDKIK